MTSGRVRTAVYLLAWVIIGLIAIDVLINVLFAYPRDPKVTNPSMLRQYFEYGRSTEGQLRRMTRENPSETAPITLTGWYAPLRAVEFPEKSPGSIVTIYGMSHAVGLGYALGRVSDRFTPRIVGAPGASTNWSYGAYLRDRGGGKSRAVVLAFMSQNLPMIAAMSPMTWTLDLPMPYTADRFYLANGSLQVIHPPYESFAQYVETFDDPVEWSAARRFFSENDPFYNNLIFSSSILDHSALLRLLRRAYEQSYLRSRRRAVLDQTGFRPDSEAVRISHAIIHQFVIQARRDGMIPVIYIVNNLGYSDYAFQALSPELRADHVPYLSSHVIASPNDPREYLPDSHFTEEVNDKLANALVKVIEKAEASQVAVVSAATP